MQLTDLRPLEDQFNLDLNFQLDMISRDPAALDQINQFLFGYVPSLRYHALADSDEVARLWTHIRSRDAVTDVVLDLTTSIVFTANLTDSSWENLVNGLAEAWGCFAAERGQDLSQIAQHEELERFAEKTGIANLIIANPWLVTLFFLRRSDYVSKHMAEAAIRAAQAYATEKSRGAPQ